MRKSTVLIAGLAALFAASSIEASAFFKPSKLAAESSVELAAGKKPKKVAAAKSCGTYMYSKDGKCVDARAKK